MQKDDTENINHKDNRMKGFMLVLTLGAIGSIIGIFVYLRLVS